MLVQLAPDTFQKTRLLEASATYDVCSASCGPRPAGRAGLRPAPGLGGVHLARLPGGGWVSLFKVLMTNQCANDCGYCVNQVGRDVPRTAFRPEELAATFWDLFQRRYVTGLFLSSGVGNDPSRAMESMLQAVEILRQRLGFTGYIHLKVMPGARHEYVERAAQLADRLSINVEAPTDAHLAKLSSRKNLADDILERMRWIHQLSQTPGAMPAGQTTQFVVGAADETDRDIFECTQRLYGEVGLRRPYFSAFQPVPGASLEGHPPTPPMREHRLYELDWLRRIYRFSREELEQAFGNDGQLSLCEDPKLTIAQRQPASFPIDLNQADPWELLRVPGIGPLSAERIVQMRSERCLRSLDDLRKLGAAAKRAAPFVVLPEHRPPPVQLALL